MSDRGLDNAEKNLRRRRLATGVGLWALVTALATAAIWAGVSVATRSVIATPLPQLAASDVSRLLPRHQSTTTPTTSSVVTRPSVDVTTSTMFVRATTTTLFASSTTTSTAVAQLGSSTTTTIARLVPRAATFASPGGQVDVVCVGATIALEAAVPLDGYAVDVRNGGPERVVVVFRAPGGTIAVAAVCRRGTPFEAPPPPPERPPPPPSSSEGGGGALNRPPPTSSPQSAP